MRPMNVIAVLCLIAVSGLEAAAGWCCCKGSNSRSYATQSQVQTYAAVQADVYYCWYCGLNGWERVDCATLGTYPAGSTAKTMSPDRPIALCLSYDRAPMAASGPTAARANAQCDYYPMVCDKCTHRLRFPRCCESWTDLYPIEWYGRPCASGACGCR